MTSFGFCLSQNFILHVQSTSNIQSPLISYIQVFTVTAKSLLVLLYNKNITTGTITHYVKHMGNFKLVHINKQ